MKDGALYSWGTNTCGFVFDFLRSQVNLQIPAVGCFKVSLVQAGLVCVLRKSSTLGGELGIVTVTLLVLDQVQGSYF